MKSTIIVIFGGQFVTCNNEFNIDLPHDVQHECTKLAMITHGYYVQFEHGTKERISNRDYLHLLWKKQMRNKKINNREKKAEKIT